MITLITRHFKPLILRTSATACTEAQQTNVAKLRRKDGQASFVADLIALRKTLALCRHCADVKMPRNWRKCYSYEELTTFHGDSACDYCREDKPVALFLAGEGGYWQEYEQTRRMAAEVKKRERQLLEKNPLAIIY